MKQKTITPPFKLNGRSLSCQSLNMAAFLMETREGTHILMLYIYFTDFNAKRIKSKINKYKINNNNTSTKHEFKGKYEGY